MKKIISVIIPIYNVERYVGKCIDSICRQEYRDLEIILVDDGSQDHSPEICDEYSKIDSRIKVLHISNQGVAAARNIGIQNACGDWVMFVDSDDWLESGCIEKISAHLDNDTEVFIYAYKKIFCKKSIFGRYFGEKTFDSREQLDFLQRWILNQYLVPEDFAISAVWGKLYRKSVLDKEMLRFESGVEIGEDKIFNLYIFQNVSKVKYVDEFVYNYRIAEKSRMNRYCYRVDRKIEIMLNHMLDFLRINDKESEFRDDYNVRLVMSIMYYVTLDYCHKDNPQKYQERKADFIDVVNSKKYASAISNTSILAFPMKQRIVFILIKLKWFWGLELLCRVKDKLSI